MFDLAPYVSNDHKFLSIDKDDKHNRLKVRNDIETFQSACDSVGGREQMEKINDSGLKEYYVNGAYIRELFIPKDTAMVTQLWKKDRFWIIPFGDVTIVSETYRKRVQGPYTEMVEPGSKIALYTHEDTLWFAISGASSIDSAEEELIAKSYKEITYSWGESWHGE